MYKNIFLPFFSLFILFASGELAIRLIGHYDSDGNFSVGKTTLRPYRLPLHTMQKTLDILSEKKGEARITYDSYLGWTNTSLGISNDGNYRYNSQSIRVNDSEKVYAPVVSDDTFRIVLIGDSFTHGDEVIFEETWGYLLEENLKNNGLPAEIINLGVSGFGMDQAFLRWEKSGKIYYPNLVIFGLQMENVRRNVNLIRPIYTPNSSIIFSKPRYIIEHDSLVIINQPCLPPDSLLAVMADFAKWNLARYEYFYRPEDYQPSIYTKSKFLAFLREQIDPDRSLVLRHPYGTRSRIYPLTEEPAMVAIKILEKMQQSIQRQETDFLVVHLPHIWGLGFYRKYGYLTYDELLLKIEKKVTLVDTKDAFKVHFPTNKNDDFYLNFHYSKLGNQIIADTLAQFILKQASR